MPNLPDRKPDGQFQLTGRFNADMWDMGEHRVFALTLKDGRKVIVADMKTVGDYTTILALFHAVLTEYAE